MAERTDATIRAAMTRAGYEALEGGVAHALLYGDFLLGVFATEEEALTSKEEVLKADESIARQHDLEALRVTSVVRVIDVNLGKLRAGPLETAHKIRVNLGDLIRCVECDRFAVSSLGSWGTCEPCYGKQDHVE